MTKVIPAVLETTVSGYRRKVALIRQLTDRFQLDVIDGEFVDNRTVQLHEVEPPSGLKLDVHLMVKRPLEYVSAAIRLRPYTVIVQAEAEEGVTKAIEKITAGGIRAGIAINPDTDLELVRENIGKLSMVLVMAYPAGFSGQKLQPATLKRVEELRALSTDIEIGLDGGVEESTLSKIAKAKFDFICTNSYLFGADSPLTRYHELIGALG